MNEVHLIIELVQFAIIIALAIKRPDAIVRTIEAKDVKEPTVLPKRKQGRVYNQSQDLDAKMSGRIVDPFD